MDIEGGVTPPARACPCEPGHADQRQAAKSAQRDLRPGMDIAFLDAGDKPLEKASFPCSSARWQVARQAGPIDKITATEICLSGTARPVALDFSTSSPTT